MLIYKKSINMAQEMQQLIIERKNGNIKFWKNGNRSRVQGSTFRPALARVVA